ncbi:MAG: protease complex subunit PrcB family protein [Ignavibacteria bacterium]|nr:protease complex subunit PrcB family protein [Ignavibacteria bacterium]
MKNLFVILAMVLLTAVYPGCSNSGSDDSKVPSEIVLDGMYSAIEEKREVLITNNEQFQSLMNEIYRNMDQMPRFPVVDFTKNSVVAVFIGERPNGGYMVSIDSITEGSRYVNVNVVETTPGPNCMTTQAITRPFAIVKIPKTDNKPVFKTKQIVKDCQ